MTEYVSYPVLPFVRDFLRRSLLEDEVIEMLCTPIPHWAELNAENIPWFGIIPAIKYVRERTSEYDKETGCWSLFDSKKFVERVHQENVGQIEDRRATIIREWEAEQAKAKQETKNHGG